MTHQKSKIFPENDQSPATKGDIDELAQITAKNFTHLEGRITHIEETMATKDDIRRLERSQEKILSILDENNQLLKETRRLPERVARLERSVFHR